MTPKHNSSTVSGKIEKPSGKLDILRVVTQASRSGAYGGPIDTAGRQCAIASRMGLATTLLAGTVSGDEPFAENHTYEHRYVTVAPLIPGRNPTSLFSMGILRNLWTLVGKTDAVHVSFSREAIPLAASVISIIRGKNLVIQPHGMLTARSSWKHSIIDLFIKPIYRQADGIIALTAHEMSALQKWDSRADGKYYILGNPVPDHTKARKRSLKDTIQIGYIARLHPRKGVSVLLEAAANLAYEKQISFIVVGPDGGELSLVKRAEVHQPNLQYLGAVSASEVVNILDTIDIFVLTSTNEPWGNVLATALSMGIPVVVTASTALANTIIEYCAGTIIDDYDSQALSDALEDLSHNPAKYSAMSEGALKLSSAFLDRNVQKEGLRNVYESYTTPKRVE